MFGCSSAAPSPTRKASPSPPPPDSVNLETLLKNDPYLKAHDAHFAPLKRWLEGNQKFLDCVALGTKEPEKYRVCVDALPPPESYIPKDRKADEPVMDYMERKQDEWDEQDCRWKGIRNARYIGESPAIEAQCMQTLEIKRLRKAIEKQNKK